MCFGGGSTGPMPVPPPSQPTRFGYDVERTQDQRNHDAVIRTANADTVNSTTMGQVTTSPGSFGSELGTSGGQ